MKNFKTIIAIFAFQVFALGVFAQNGIIRGSLTDATNGEPLMFASVAVEGTTIGSDTDLDGAYELRVAPGTYTLVFSYVGYATQKVTDVKIEADKVEVFDIVMQEEGEMLEEIVVTAEVMRNTDAGMITLQKKSLNTIDGISAQGIKKFASSNAADAIMRTPGASVVDGKYVIVRGLGDRYSNSMLNGQLLPSTDPYRNSTQLDLIPANLLDNVISSKTFTPDQPGNFTGGSINVKTKSFPEKFTLNASVNAQYNTESSLRDNFLTHDGSSTDWLGFDGGFRAPDPFLRDPLTLETLTNSTYIKARTQDDVASILQRSSSALSTQMDPVIGNSSLNHSAAFSVGNRFNVGKNPLGVLFGVNFRKRYSFYENGENRFWELIGANEERLNTFYNLSDTRGVESPTIGGLFNLAYKIGGHSSISFNTLYNHDADKSSRYLVGEHPGILASGLLESNTLEFRERELLSYQLIGEHTLGGSGIEIEWGGSIVSMTQDEPDLRKYANRMEIIDDEGNVEYEFDRAEFPMPQHIWRYLKDDQIQGKFDISIPFLRSKSSANKIKVGAMYTSKDREFEEFPFELNERSADAPDYDGSVDFWGPNSFGILGQNPNNGRNLVGNFWMDQELLALENSYTGTETFSAAYGMGVFDLDFVKIIAGARAERTEINVASLDTTEMKGAIDVTDLLPSFSFIFSLNEDMNIRTSYTHTIARPNMRELAPFASDDFVGGFLIAGNPDLKRTLIKNIDLRWEWFPKAGEMIAASAFYKDFETPIVKAFLPIAANPTIQFQNVDQATVYGLEFEFRKSLGFIAPALDKLKFNTNVSFIRSFVDIPEDELTGIENFNPEKGDTRPFFGQSDFLFNAGLNYVDRERKLDALLSLNIFGKRLVQQSEAEIPDVFEQPRPQLDFSLQKSLNDNFDVRIIVQNILNAETRHTMGYRDVDYTVIRYRTGINFSLGISYKL